MQTKRTKHIPLHKPLWGKKAEAAVLHSMRTWPGTADGPESTGMRERLKRVTGAPFAIPVTSCTHAMEAIVAVLGAKTGDEVIVPSFTLASTATAVMIRGAKPVFADIDPITMSLDPKDVERRITKRTVGIMTVHYAGFAGAGFDALMKLSRARHLWLVEDAAHCIGSRYRGRALGTFGIAGAMSFHGTKNVAAGEGGAILTKSEKLADGLEVFRSIGTDRMAFLAGKVSAYRWIGEGSSFMLSDILASLINVQLDQITKINKDRNHIASQYIKSWKQFEGKVRLPSVPSGMTDPNWHIFALRFGNKLARDTFLGSLKAKGIEAASHYMPLHSAPMGRKLSGKTVRLPATEEAAATVVRMPIYADMTARELDYVITTVSSVLRAL